MRGSRNRTRDSAEDLRTARSFGLAMAVSRIFQKDRPLIIAHRGNPDAAPENTLSALKSALEIGVDFLETDLRLTKDNEIVLFHDDDLVRVASQEGVIRNMTLDELCEIDIGYNFTTDDGETFPHRGEGHKIVTLKEAFEAFPDSLFNLDIKDKDTEAPEILAGIIKDHSMENSVIVASFNDAQAVRFRYLMPEVPSAACPGEVSRFVFALKMRTLGLLSRDYKYNVFQVPLKYGLINLIDSRFIKAAHERNVAVHVWTINDRDRMEWLTDLGVDGIFTDNPGLMREMLTEKGLL